MDPQRGATTWRPVLTGDGSWTLRHPLHGEACHSRAGAWRQARERYAAPCRLPELASSAAQVRLLDVGTGLGLNLAAALEALHRTPRSGARLAATTLELEADVLRAALRLPPGPAEQERWHAPVRRALERALAPGASGEPVPLGEGGALGTLRLVLGDARSSLPRLAPEPPFDAVFLDPFSPRRDPALWEEAFLAEVARRMAPQAVLSTYSSAFAVRLALLRSGLRVGLGPRVATKGSGTLASRAGSLPELDPRTRRRLERRLHPPSEPPAPPRAPAVGRPAAISARNGAPEQPFS
ncbi:MAG TPA: MnmC family methyltransferase [Planctomycetota bacterium]|nr:MnmC family methyltransferase [Planctomycetota bacterium]